MRVVIAVFVIGSSACTVGEPADDRGGESESGFPQVGTLRAEGVPFCSGTLVSDRVIVTAGHCLAGGLLPSPTFVAAGLELDIAVGHPHPALGSGTAADIGVALLVDPAPIVPLPFASIDGQAILGDVLHIGHIDDEPGSARSIELAITKLGEASFRAGEDTSALEGCKPLMGGPAIARIDGVDVVVGVTSDGDQFCRREALSTRVDAHLEFLGRFGAQGETDDDVCAAEGWYGDGVCDEFCDEPDPDCEGEPEAGDICEENGWYTDMECDTFCPMPDPDCAA